MFCGTETPLTDPFASVPETDPLTTQTISDSSDDEPNTKRPKMEINTPSLNLKVYQIPDITYNNSKNDFTIYPTSPNSLPKFVNNPLNLANPLALNAYLNKPLTTQNRHSLPNLVKPPHVPCPQLQNKSLCEPGGVVRYKKNGEIAKKRGPPKGYKRKPKVDQSQMSAIQTLTNNLLLQAQNTILTNLLATSSGLLHKNIAAASGLLNKNIAAASGFVNKNISYSALMNRCVPTTSGPVNKHIVATNGLLDKSIASLIPADITVSPQLTITPQVKVPEGVELVELDLDPSDWFPEEPYKMSFSRKKNPKWKLFPYRCEHCFKGYRVLPTLLAHAAERHGSVPKEFAIPCPCCPHVSTRRKHHKKHLETHSTRRGKLFCIYCIPLQEENEPFKKVSERFPFDKFPQYWYASEESLRLHKKRKHPYSAMYNYNWYGTWGDNLPNS